MSKSVISFLFSFLSAIAIIAVQFLPADHWISNLEVAVHVWIWALIILGSLGAFMELPEENRPIRSVALTVLWIGALAYAGWTYALGLYVVMSLIFFVRRLDEADKL